MTVSNAFSRPDQLSDALRERILSEAEGLGYVGPDPSARYAMIVAVADALDAARDDLVAVGQQETNLPQARLAGEVNRTTVQLRMFAEEARSGELFDARLDEPDPDFAIAPRPDIRRMKRPIGVVLNFAASNFPFAFSVAGGDTAAAWAAGCPVVVKAHEGHPQLSRLTAEAIAGALARTGAHPGMFGLIEGRDNGVLALSDDRVDAACFTGSVAGGVALARIAADRPRPIPFYGELGSINPVIVTEAAFAARRDEILAGFVDSFTLGVGQFCTKPGLLFLPAGPDWRPVLAERLGTATTAPMLSDTIRGAFERSREALLADLGGTQIGGAEILGTEPSVVVVDHETFRAHRDRLLEEVFGPFAVIVEYGNAGDVDALPDDLRGLGSLTCSLQAEPPDAAWARDLIARLADRVGRFLWNQWPTGVAVTPAQHHGGPFPATTHPGFTSVGTAAVERFLVPVAFQGFPEDALPAPVRSDNPWRVPQRRSSAGQSRLWGRS